ncbi:MAG: D-tyrosyl-tRNA(Tyr) deacylase [Gammaproteobacteria bacterium]|nr:D-tyrosyl-tRNA(Tyr) deacylase [Gammaproteobacteria bacterium]
MIALLQRVKFASVTVDEEKIASIQQGLLVLLGVEKNDNEHTVEKLAEKILKYRIFADSDDKMNLSVLDINGSILMVPQFTLAADTQKGLRPSFSGAASPEKGLALFTQLIDIMRVKGDLMADNLPVNWLQAGQFGADMAVELLNDGPVTFNLTM